MDNTLQTIKDKVAGANRIVVLQADNPDADSLGSALSLEHILSDMGKEVSLYCAVEIPTYLRYMIGWDRVENEIPQQFDLSIIVDASTMTLLEKLSVKKDAIHRLSSKPCLVFDHHAQVSNEIPFATTVLNNEDESSTGELIYGICKKLDWSMSIEAQTFIMSAIMGDTQGLSNQMAKPHTYRTVADMIEHGVDRFKLEELRRQYSKMPDVIYSYKAKLILRTEFYSNNRIATVSVPHHEIKQYSPLYNPAPLIQGDMLQIDGVEVAIVFKFYDDGHVTGAIRCNNQAPFAAQIAEHFGGGGHIYASGFKSHSHKSFEQIKQECVTYTTDLLNNQKKEGRDESVQYSL